MNDNLFTIEYMFYNLSFFQSKGILTPQEKVQSVLSMNYTSLLSGRLPKLQLILLCRLQTNIQEISWNRKLNFMLKAREVIFMIQAKIKNQNKNTKSCIIYRPVLKKGYTLLSAFTWFLFYSWLLYCTCKLACIIEYIICSI